MEQDPSEAFFDAQPPPLYETLGLQKDASDSAIRTAYRRQALLSHPDKLPKDLDESEREAREERFRQISFAYTVLSASNRKERFDKTGRTDEITLDTDDETLEEYFRDLFDEVTEERIDDFFKEYEGSEEEEADIKAAYLTSNGSIEYILEHVFSRDNTKAEDRFTKIVNELISRKNLNHLSNWKPEDKKSRNKRRKQVEKEAKEAEELAKEIGADKELAKLGKNGKKGTGNSGKAKKGKRNGNDGDDDDEEENNDNDDEGLKSLIQQRGAKRMDGFLKNLAAKYGADDYDETLDAPPPPKSKRGKKSQQNDNSLQSDPKKRKNEEPSEEEFAKAQAKIMARKTAASDR